MVLMAAASLQHKHFVCGSVFRLLQRCCLDTRADLSLGHGTLSLLGNDRDSLLLDTA